MSECPTPLCAYVCVMCGSKGDAKVHTDSLFEFRVSIYVYVKVLVHVNVIITIRNADA